MTKKHTFKTTMNRIAHMFSFLFVPVQRNKKIYNSSPVERNFMSEVLMQLSTEELFNGTNGCRF